MAPTPIVELGVAEAYQLLTERLGVHDLPPLVALENEDWGRDYLLSRVLALSVETLAELGITLEDGDCSGTPGTDDGGGGEGVGIGGEDAEA